MSIVSYNAAGVTNPVPVKLTTTSKTQVLEGFENASTLSSLLLSNESGSAVVVKVYFDNGTTEWQVITKSIPATDFVLIEGLAFRLRGGATISVEAATGNAITVTPFVTANFSNDAMAR